MTHEEKLWKAADAGNLDDLNKLLAAGADPNGFKNSVRGNVMDSLDFQIELMTRGLEFRLELGMIS